MTEPNLSIVPMLPLGPTADARMRRVCIVSPDVWGPVRNGGIGTVYRNLAFALQQDGHHVTILYTRRDHTDGDEPIEHWIDFYSDRGIELIALGDSPNSVASGVVSATCERSYAVYEWLRRQEPFDVVHGPDFVGLLHYAVLAKDLEAAFEQTTFVVSTHSGAWWNFEGNARLPKRFEDAVRMFRERTVVEGADVVVSSSSYMVNWLASHGISLPDRTYVWPNATPGIDSPQSADTDTFRPVAGIAFAGRIEPRKGAHIFVAGIRQIVEDLPPGFRVVFMGKTTPHFDIHGHLESLQELAPHLDFELHDDLDSDEAFEMLESRQLLAVMPSIQDNSPMMVSECIERSLPFLATATGGIGELIEQADRARACVEPTPHDLAESMRRIVEAGGADRCRPAADEEQINRTWVDWHARLGAPVRPAPVAVDASAGAHVTIGLVHHERPHQLRSALKSIVEQTVPPAQVILVDNGSTDPEAHEYLDSLESDGTLDGIPLTVIRGPNLYPGAARNLVAERSTTDFLLFMDDDNIARPQMLETLLDAATKHPDSAAFTCFFDRFVDESDLDDPAGLDRVLYPGDAGALGLLENVWGDVNALVRRSAFEAIGGFHENWGIGREDHAFFAEMSLSGQGVRIVPSALFFYRMSPSTIRLRHISQTSGPSVVANRGAAWVAPELRPFIELAAGAWMGTRELQRQNSRMRQGLNRVRSELRQQDERLHALNGLLRGAGVTRDPALVNRDDARTPSSSPAKKSPVESQSSAGSSEAEGDLRWLLNRLDKSVAGPLFRRYPGFRRLRERWLLPDNSG